MQKPLACQQNLYIFQTWSIWSGYYDNTLNLFFIFLKHLKTPEKYYF